MRSASISSPAPLALLRPDPRCNKARGMAGESSDFPGGWHVGRKDKNKDVPYSLCPAAAFVTTVTKELAGEELNKGRIYRLNDVFFKFLFGQEEPLCCLPSCRAMMDDKRSDDRQADPPRHKGRGTCRGTC